MRMVLGAALALSLMSMPAQADEIEDTINAALEAYRAGDMKLAKEELDFASQLVAQQKAAGLGAFLPGALPGWDRSDSETDAQSAAMFGGGMIASASYSGPGESLEIQIMADNQLVNSMAMMLSNPLIMGQMGTVKRVGGEKVVLTNEGELQTMIDGRILIQITGSASAESKLAYFEAIDIEALKAF